MIREGFAKPLYFHTEFMLLRNEESQFSECIEILKRMGFPALQDGARCAHLLIHLICFGGIVGMTALWVVITKFCKAF